MGFKTSKFFKSLFGFKTPHHPQSTTAPLPKRRWSFIKSHKDKPSLDASRSAPRATPIHRNHCSSADDGGDGSNNHAIAVAAATAAVAEAAVAAAQAAAEVVRMTSRTDGAGYGLTAELAAVKIQSHFRAYLARRALRALKALVKLQALVKGHILRKRTADMMRRLQAMLRVQARARAGRFAIADSPQSTAKGPPTPEKFEHVMRSRSIKHDHPSVVKNNGLNSKSFSRGITDDEKILEIDTTKPHITHPRRRTLFQSDQISYTHSQSLTTSRGSTLPQPAPSPTASYEVNSNAQTTPFLEEDLSFCTAQNSPPFYSFSSKGNGSMRAGPFTPAKSDGSRSCLSGYSDHPNYMAYTESSRAKVRSLSAPRQRPQFEFPGTTKRCSVYGSGVQRGSNLRDSFMSKAYPGSGRLDRLGMPVGGLGLGLRESEFSDSYWN